MARHPAGPTSKPRGVLSVARFRLPLVLGVLVFATVIGPAGAAWAAQPEPDATYLKASHEANLAEIQAGQRAQINGNSRCVRQVGAVLVRDHRKLDAQALPVVGELGVELPTVPSAAQRQALAAVEAKAGTSGYDAAWLKAQDAQHRQTLRLIDQELSGGKSASAKAVARGARPVVQMHLDMVRGGTCRTGSGASSVGAGDGGQAAQARRLRELGGAALLGIGLLLLASGGVVAVRRRATGRTG